MTYIPVKSVEHLKELCSIGQHNYSLCWGRLSSCKHITLFGEGFRIFNEIDGSETICSERELDEETNIPDAIRERAFFCLAASAR